MVRGERNEAKKSKRGQSTVREILLEVTVKWNHKRY